MKKIMLACAIIITCATASMATGIGVYTDFGAGESSWSGGVSGSTGDIIVQGGLIIDTSLAKNKIFNYRVKLGGGKILNSFNFNKISFIQTFGVSPSNLRGTQAKFWFGPRIGMHYVGGEIITQMDPMNMMLLGPLGILMGGEISTKIHMFRFDLGLVLLGFNFNLGNHFTMTFEFGFNYGINIGAIEGSSGDPTTGTGYEGFASIGFLFRINDTYDKVKQKL